ncbi:hypothetical protein QYF36_014400 [Acer negundo]|nr:hypothetical protein QYF36_014400 [Acer negundo]
MKINLRTYSLEENLSSQSDDELEDSSSIAKEKSGNRGVWVNDRKVSDGLKDLHKSVEAIHNAVEYVKSSPSILDRFKRTVEHEKLGNNGFVVLDVPTWWNSTYLMLESAVKFRKAFEPMEEEDGH